MEQLNEIQRSLGRVEGNLKSLVKLSERTDARLNNHSGRIRKLENWRWYIIGAVGAVIGLVGFIMRF